MGVLQYRLRSILYYVLLLLVGFFATLIGVVASLCGRRFDTNYYVARTFWHVAGPLVGWKFDVEGEEHLDKLRENDTPAVILGNHQNAVDILYLGRIFPKRASIMAKRELKWVPGLGWFMMLSGSIFINRGNNKSAVGMMQAAGEEMKRKRISLFIFPEGTRHLSDTPELLPFKKGAFHLAVQAGTPIVPIVVENYSKLLKPGKYFKRGTIKIRVLPPIETKGLEAKDVNDLVERTRGAMTRALAEISTEMPPVAKSVTTKSPLLAGQPDASYKTMSPATQKATLDEPAEVEVLPASAAVEGDDGLTLRASTSVDTKATKDTDATVKVAPVEPVNVKDSSGKLAIAMVSDFFHPEIGGVEGHIYSLSVELMRRGHKVIVVTHHREERRGIRYLAPGLKVYHIPYVSIASNATLPNFLLFAPYIRTILLREQIDIVHGHATLSSLAHEAIYIAPRLGIRTVFTDHSLFGFGDAVGVLTNKLLAGALRNVDGVVAVSHTGRENTSLRAEVEPGRVWVVPNALVPGQFEPERTLKRKSPGDDITIVVISRLVHRKGIDLLVAAAPTLCTLHPTLRFLVCGDGPKMVDLLQMREAHALEDRIQLTGAVRRPADVRALLNRGDVYLSTSLTEAFGISIIEAACAGLFVVATRVGGVPEILPRDMVEFARADEDDVVRALGVAVRRVMAARRRAEGSATVDGGTSTSTSASEDDTDVVNDTDADADADADAGSVHDKHRAHARVSTMYSWATVAARTETIYASILATPPRTEAQRLARWLSLGPVFGPIMCVIMGVAWWYLVLMEWVWPAGEIDAVPGGWDLGAFSGVVEREKRRVGRRGKKEEEDVEDVGDVEEETVNPYRV